MIEKKEKEKLQELIQIPLNLQSPSSSSYDNKIHNPIILKIKFKTCKETQKPHFFKLPYKLLYTFLLDRIDLFE